MQRNDRQMQICQRSVSQSDLIRPVLTRMETVKVLSNRPSNRKRASSLKTKSIVVLVLAVLAGLLSGAVLTTPNVHAMNGSVSGGVYWADQYGNLHPMSWAQVTADNGESASTTDGSYVLFLPPGTYTITAEAGPAYVPDSANNVVISSGSSTSIDFTLQPTGKPVPELPPWAQPLILLSAIVVTVVALRRYRPRPQA
jgi:hypothetical protein